MKLIFAGTPRFAAVALDALLAAGHEACAVLTQPDRPAGRGMKLTPSPVKALASRHGLPVLQPSTLRDPAMQAELRALGADALVVVAYGLILPQAVLDAASRGAYNIHASLLPRWRGAAPIQRALLAGDRETGVCIMRMDAGLDTGPVLLREAIAITDDDTAGTLHDRLAALGARLVIETLARLDSLTPQPQPEEGVTYATKIARHEAQIDWSEPAESVWRKIRAFDPAPGAHAGLNGERIKMFAAHLDRPCSETPGTVLTADDEGVLVAASGRVLRVLELQRAGGRRLGAAEFLRGLPLHAGQRFTALP